MSKRHIKEAAWQSSIAPLVTTGFPNQVHSKSPFSGGNVRVSVAQITSPPKSHVITPPKYIPFAL